MIFPYSGIPLFFGCGIGSRPDDGSIRHHDIAADLYAGCDAVDSIRDRFTSYARLYFKRNDDAGDGKIIR